MEEPITRDTTVDALERRLRDAIIDGRHPVGALLPPERELAASYGVNRTTLKHAFVRLMQSGLVETRHGVGTRVRDFWRLGTAELLPVLVLRDDAWLGEIFEVRRQVGALLGALAARRAGPPHIAELRQQVAAVRTGSDSDQVQLADAEFHRTLARATGNRVYLLMTNTLLGGYLPVRQALAQPFQDAEAAADRLHPVAEAVAAGDEDAARRAVEAYMTDTEALMRAQGEKPPARRRRR
ncbi:FadR/GntR family transcriptional regulator [Streptomyces decoyicus]|uniref:FadR/GntR family transcriptional regulator n=1 Tax=Streptomyces decoyicus TaxID=249567 RepID=UPI00069D3BC7|nr:FCD domain-containing protein [Streptomyces decoyicus]KOG38062.1 fatty acid metabolism transcriptional regulator FadR [Streptomyces decoyicus]QZY14254.1 FCD domain-containing protein [Streptomyces decoyicus]